MIIYLCLFCGGEYHTTSPLVSCTVCGQTTSSGWFREESRRPAANSQKRIGPSPAPDQRFTPKRAA
jgi:hypothetical protein